jgi:hypothetical protein
LIICRALDQLDQLGPADTTIALLCDPERAALLISCKQIYPVEYFMNNNPQRPQSATITVGDLISKLCRWPDHAAISFRSPLTNAELHFSRIYGPCHGLVEVELQAAEERVTVAPA